MPLKGIDHYGGVTVVGDYTYVSGDGKLQVYRTEDLLHPHTVTEPPLVPGWDPITYTPAPNPINFADDDNPNTTTEREQAFADGVPVSASSTVTNHNGDLFVTSWNPDGPGTMYRYEIGPGGRPIPTGDSYVAPPNTQGVSIDDSGNAYFSTSFGRVNDSELVFVSADDMNSGGWNEENEIRERLPKMSEGSVIVDDRLYHTYESGSKHYGTSESVKEKIGFGIPGLDKVSDMAGVIERRDRMTVHKIVPLERNH